MTKARQKGVQKEKKPKLNEIKMKAKKQEMN